MGKGILYYCIYCVYLHFHEYDFFPLVGQYLAIEDQYYCFSTLFFIGLYQHVKFKFTVTKK